MNAAVYFLNGALNPLFFRFALPNMGSALMASVYLVADGIFVGRYLGGSALAAVNLAMPLLTVTFMAADMIAMGASVQIALHLGRKQKEMADRLFTFALALLFGMSLLVSLVMGSVGMEIPALLGAEPELAAMTGECLLVYALCAPLVMPFFAVDNYLRLCGHPRGSLAVNICVGVLNIGLDFLFLGICGWGIWSAILASCLSFSLGTVLGLAPFLAGYMPLRLRRGLLPFRYVRVLAVSGASEFFSNVSDTLFLLLANMVLLDISGTKGVAAFSLLMYLDAMVLVLLRSLSDAMQPAISCCFGAGKQGRSWAIEKRVLAAGAFLSLLAFFSMYFGGHFLTRLFLGGHDPEVAALAVEAMAVFSFSYLTIWLGIGLGDFFIAANRPVPALLQSVSQTFLFPALFMAALTPFLHLDGVWLATAAGRGAAAALAVVLFGLCGGKRMRG